MPPEQWNGQLKLLNPGKHVHDLLRMTKLDRVLDIVYNVKPGEGMGVKFVQMRGDDRLRLNQFLQTQFKRLKSGL